MSGANNNSTLHSPHSTLVTTPEQLVQIYINAEKKLTDIIQAKARASSPAAYERSLLKQIDDELRKLRVTSAKGVTELIEHFYESGLQQLVEQLAQVGENRTYNMFSRLNRRQIEIIARNTNGDFNKAIKMIGRRTQDTVRKITLESTAEKLTTGQTIRQMQKSLAKAFENEHLTCVEYSNGAKMPISKYAEMTARSTTAEAQNSSQFVQAKDWGYDLVKMTSHSPTCAVCAKYQGRVYATTKQAANGKYKDKDGKRLKFPYLYDTVLVKGYDTVHPNCRHRFSIYPARAYTTEELKKASQNSMREFTDDRSDDERKAYAKEQAEKRQKNENLKQYEKLKAMFPDDAPKSFAGFVRMKNAKSERYKQLINDSRTITRLANERESGIIKDSSGDYHAITDITVNSVPYVKVEGFTEKQNLALQEAHRQLLKTAQKEDTGVEVSAVYDINMRQIGETRTDHKIGSVTIDNPDEYYIGIHNHGSDKTFSIDDISKFAIRKNMRILTVIGNKGSVYIIQKNADYDQDGFLNYLIDIKKRNIFNDYSFNQIVNDKSIINSLSQKEIEILKSTIIQFSADVLKGSENYGIKYIKKQIDSGRY
ncbi:MAG: hypothetical protein PUG48_03650 [Clostridia bacterium]|nr:hypothetical protein [Clostridia bacterium]